MSKKEKDRNPKFFYILSIISLIILFIVLSYGMTKINPNLLKNMTKTLVLGESASFEEKGNFVNSILENAVSNTKEKISEKLVDVEKNVKSALEKEINSFTQSQIESLKLKVCTDWGVVKTTPTPQNEEPAVE